MADFTSGLNSRNHGNGNTGMGMLTNEEEARIGECTTFTDLDIQHEMEKFSANRNICISHHKYLRHVTSFVIKVGGQIVEDTVMLVNLYDPKLVILEPIPAYANSLTMKFESHSRVTVLNFGLGKRNEVTKVNYKSNTSVNMPENSKINKEVKDASDFFRSIRVGKFDVDLLMLECNGCELDVLINIIESGLVKYFKNIQIVSAHAHNAYTKFRYCESQELLSRTHRATFQYKYISENWRRKDIP